LSGTIHSNCSLLMLPNESLDGGDLDSSSGQSVQPELSVESLSPKEAATDLSLEPQQSIAAALREVSSAEELAVLLNRCLPAYLQQHPQAKPKLLTARVINYYAFHKQARRYRTFQIPKRARGEMRELKAPDQGLLRIQRLLLLCLIEAFPVADKAAHGFVNGRSVLTNALPHVGRRFVLNLDLKDFFPHTHIGRVAAILQQKPFSLTRSAAYLIGNLCCDLGSLPQGAPTSPLLTNAVCQPLDRKLRQLAAAYRCSYTRYADDLTFSSNRAVFTAAFHQELDDIIKGQNYEQNLKKQRLQTARDCQQVTGVTVNVRTNVPRDYFRLVRTMLHNWQTKGYEVANRNFRRGYAESKGGLRHGGKCPPMERVIAGKLAYIGMIRGAQDSQFLRLLQQFKLLTDKEYADLSEALSIMEQIAGIHGGPQS
jgi:RNA-directed DNA polymerase